MSIGPGELLVLDTSIVVHLARNDPTGQKIEASFSLMKRIERPLISTVTEGEILGLAFGWKWGKKKVTVLRELLAELVRVEAGLPEVVNAYAELYLEKSRQGQGIGENDLWIAATAKATGATLMTCDQHFDWMNPSLIKVQYIPESK